MSAKTRRVEPTRVVCEECGPLRNTMAPEKLASLHGGYTHHRVRLVTQSEWQTPGGETVKEAEFGPRQWWRCQLRDNPGAILLLGHCFGPVNGHELKKRSQGGSIVDPANIILLCDRHNGAVEDYPREARRMGLVK